MSATIEPLFEYYQTTQNSITTFDINIPNFMSCWVFIPLIVLSPKWIATTPRLLWVGIVTCLACIGSWIQLRWMDPVTGYRYLLASSALQSTYGPFVYNSLTTLCHEYVSPQDHATAIGWFETLTSTLPGVVYIIGIRWITSPQELSIYNSPVLLVIAVSVFLTSILCLGPYLWREHESTKPLLLSIDGSGRSPTTLGTIFKTVCKRSSLTYLVPFGLLTGTGYVMSNVYEQLAATTFQDNVNDQFIGALCLDLAPLPIPILMGKHFISLLLLPVFCCR
jgi:hypothetical protein